MKAWLRLTLVTLTVGGGFLGIIGCLQWLGQADKESLINYIMLAVFAALYAFTLASGLILVQNSRLTAPMFIALIFQIPWISSPFLEYNLAVGLQATPRFVGGGFHGEYSLGSSWHWSLSSGAPWGLGVNLVAVVLVILLARAGRKARTNWQPGEELADLKV